MNTRSKTKLQNRSFIENLPTEMHLEIFQYLDSWSIRRIAQTCMTFFNVTLRHEFKEHFKLKMLDTYLAPDCGIGEVFKAKNRTVRKFTGLSIGKVDMKTLAFAKNFFMRIGKDVTELHMRSSFFNPLMMVPETEKIETNLRNEILKNFPNLKKLIVDDSKIMDILSFYMRSLKEIVVKEALLNHNTTENAYTDMLQNEKGATGLTNLLMSKVIYPCDCIMNRPNKIHQLSHEVRQIINEMVGLVIWKFESIETDCNILDHKTVAPDCVKGIALRGLYQIPYTSFVKFPNLESIDLSLVPSMLTSGFTNHSPRPDLKRIKNLRVKMTSDLNCYRCISDLFTSFTGLRVLDCRGNFTEMQIRLIFTSMPDLEELTLVSGITSTLFDSAEHQPDSIENLKNLKTLKIVNDNPVNFFLGALSDQSLLNFAPLPQLTCLYLEDLSTFSLDGIQSLVNKCPNISTFYSTSSSFNSSMVQEIVRGWPKLHTLVLENPSSLDAETWVVMKENCRFLTSVCFATDQPSLTFLEECSLFKKISTLKTIKSGATYLNLRTFTRTEYYEQETYLDRYHKTYTPGQLKRKRPSSQGSNKRRRLSYTAELMQFRNIPCITVDPNESDNTDSDDEEPPRQHLLFENVCVIA